VILIGSRLLDARTKSHKLPECPRVLLSREGDFETDSLLAGDFECGGFDFLVIEPYAETAHRISVVDFEGFRDKHCDGENGLKLHAWNFSCAAYLRPLNRLRDNQS